MGVECFVTGGSGFVGQHLLARLSATGHKTWVLMRNRDHLERLREQVGQLGGNPANIHAVAGDISRDGLGLSEADRQSVSCASVVFHLAAAFSWGLTMERARAVNVQGALRVARLAASLRVRLVMVGGYMVQNFAFLTRIGVDYDCPANTDWPAVYSRVGGYEGSKLESHFAVIRYMQQAGADYTIVHPATVCGHSEWAHPGRSAAGRTHSQSGARPFQGGAWFHPALVANGQRRLPGDADNLRGVRPFAGQPAGAGAP